MSGAVWSAAPAPPGVPEPAEVVPPGRPWLGGGLVPAPASNAPRG